MSHFNVIVIGDDVEGALAPFQENNMGDCPEQYLVFHDVEDEYRSKYETEFSEQVRLEDGTLVLPWDERFRQPNTFGLGSGTHKVPDHLERVEIPFKTLYSSFEAYAKDWCGYDKKDEKTNRYGYWENPNAKWDWWTVGGRWSGYFPTAHGKVDSALKSEIQWDTVRNEREAAARTSFARWKQALDTHPTVPRPKSFEEILNLTKDIDEARARYNTQPQISTWLKLEEAATGRMVYGINPVSDFGFDIDEMVSRVRRKASVPFAFLVNGEWHERGEMGFWGSVSDEKALDDWCSEWESTWEALPDSARLTCVDCHI